MTRGEHQRPKDSAHACGGHDTPFRALEGAGIKACGRAQRPGWGPVLPASAKMADHDEGDLPYACPGRPADTGHLVWADEWLPAAMAARLSDAPVSVLFVGATTGRWSIERLHTVAGSPLASTLRLRGARLL